LEPGSLSAGDWSTTLVLGLLFLLCESAPTLLNVPRVAVSVSYSAALAAVVLVGPVGAALVGLTAVVSVRPGIPLVKRLFNGAQYVICGYAAGWAFLRAGGEVGLPQVEDFPGILIPYSAATVAFVAVNFVLTAVIVRLAREVGRGQVLLRPMVQFLGSYVGYAVFGLLIAALWVTVQSISAMLVLLPLFVARWAFGHYHAEQRSYDATIAALCQAVETKDYYTRGHCTRVSLASSMIAEEIGMGTEGGIAAIQRHPMRGLEIVRGIDFLDEAFAGIMHHHERYDGKGYPMGLAGSEIPEFARIIAVADAFDSMTSDRAYRKAKPIEVAVAELRKNAGTQFDPEMVYAFIKALERKGWNPPQRSEERRV